MKQECDIWIKREPIDKLCQTRGLETLGTLVLLLQRYGQGGFFTYQKIAEEFGYYIKGNPFKPDKTKARRLLKFFEQMNYISISSLNKGSFMSGEVSKGWLWKPAK